MPEVILTIFAGLIGVLTILVKTHYSKEATKKRTDHERDKEIAEKDHPAKSRRLSDLLDAVKLRDSEK